jgi:hypothetical protein
MADLLKKNWEYTLSDYSRQFRLSVVCGTVGLYEIDIYLDESEIEKYNELGNEFIDKLVKSIQEFPNDYARRKI